MSVESIQAALAAHADAGGSTSIDTLGNTVIDAPDVSASAEEGTPDSQLGVDAGELPVAAEGAVADPATPEQKAVEQDEIDKLLAAEGIQPTSTRGENRIPYSRMKSVQKNLQAKWEADIVTPLRTQVTQLTESTRNYQNAERLAMQDPDRYIAGLAAADPRYQKFLSGGGQPAQTPQERDAANDPEPQALKDADGNPYYTPERWQELQSWNRRQAERGAVAAMEAKYGPLLSKQMQAEQARQEFEARKPNVDRQIKAVNDTFGDKLVKDNEAAIVKIMQDGEAAGYYVSLAEAAAQVLLPLLRADEAKIREKVVADLNKRPAAASRTVAASQRGIDGTDTGVALSGAEIIKRELDRVAPNRNR